jgi:ABC-type polysaccharide/polyol phosphate export permease
MNFFDIIRKELWFGFRNISGWWALSRRNLASLNRRSSIGLLWQMLSTIIFIGMLSLVYSMVFSINLADYMPYIALGYVNWMFISNSIASAPDIMLTHKEYLLNKTYPYGMYFIANTVSKLTVYGLQMLVALFVALIFGYGFSWASLILPVSALVLTTFNFSLSMLIGIIAVRFRDLGPLINAGLLIIFLSTPILWNADLLKGRAAIVAVNPFYHAIEVVRGPVMSARVPWESLGFVVLLSAVLMLLALEALRRSRRTLVYYL